MTRFAAFLLGINVGGNRKVPMAKLKSLLEEAGFANVKTLLASGNVLLDAKGTAATVTKKLEQVIQAGFGFEVGVILRTVHDLQALADTQPFAGIPVTPATRLYVTFLAEKPQPTIAIPYTSPDDSLRILSLTDTELISVLTVNQNAGTTDAMKLFAKQLGKKITTRNWNTIEKILKASR